MWSCTVKDSHRSCPGCEFVISQLGFELSAHDYLCPRCEVYKISEFVEFEWTSIPD